MGSSIQKNSKIIIVDDGKVKSLKSETHFLWML